MQWTKETLSTDPKDKIFALLGLYHDGLTFVPVPNYQQSLETILADMTKMMIRMHRSLDFIFMKGLTLSEQPKTKEPISNESNRISGSVPGMLSGGGALEQRKPEKLPSWCPNWPGIWSGGMTLQESRFNEWYTPYQFNLILDGSSNKFLRDEGRWLANVKTMTSKQRRGMRDNSHAY
jgi:hypothetical protein